MKMKPFLLVSHRFHFHFFFSGALRCLGTNEQVVYNIRPPSFLPVSSLGIILISIVEDSIRTPLYLKLTYLFDHSSTNFLGTASSRLLLSLSLCFVIFIFILCCKKNGDSETNTQQTLPFTSPFLHQMLLSLTSNKCASKWDYGLGARY